MYTYIYVYIYICVRHMRLLHSHVYDMHAYAHKNTRVYVCVSVCVHVCVFALNLWHGHTYFRCIFSAAI